ncbi:MAG TPA: DNA repair protein RecN [Phycisphaerae bacterium]|nr:DNA repair protein RecN [Phycisphaerae bacterium]HPS53175.1 DNA repair protein RecN [Phycisphaerae bacterium]
MLRELHISNLAVIEDAAFDLQPGLNVFTGQTGAGKSLIIGAFELLLGLRGGGRDSAGMLRSGCDEACVCGLFEFSDSRIVHEIESIIGRQIEDSQMLITRRLFATGRSSVSIDGQPATAAMLREIGQFLVDIHGQHDQQFLLKPSNQLEILDDFAAMCETQKIFSQTFTRLRDLKKRRDDLNQSELIRRNQTELLEFQAGEIDAADIQPGEFESVREKFERLSNIGTLKQDASQVAMAVYESEGSAVEILERAAKVMDELVSLDEKRLNEISQNFADATEMLRDVAAELNRYADNLEIEPGELEETQQRLDELNGMIHKYGPGREPTANDPLEIVLKFREQVEMQLEKLRTENTELAGLDDEMSSLTKQLAEIGRKLTAGRNAAADKIAPLIEKELSHLGMEQAKFRVQIVTHDVETCVSPAGLDEIEFMVQTNPGLAFQPLRAIASGGEISRIMLAIKSILAAGDRVSVLVFDEIDANIGGRLGAVVGRKMRDLARRGGHQVLCITHLPQLAAFGDYHIHIEKHVEKGMTRTTVAPLEGSRRIDELAAMLAGHENVSQASITQAAELMQAAAKIS